MNQTPLIQFEHVSFGYSEDHLVLKEVNLKIMEGGTYALVGPTGNGKSTSAGLMMRLFDPNSGKVLFKGRDIRSYSPQELSASIGFILQEPFLFSGTIGDNIRYGNPDLHTLDDQGLVKKLEAENLTILLETFDDGLNTEVHNNSQNISLGQKQLISFIRIILRKPELLIMDEATANIDTVTESLMQSKLRELTKTTTQVIIAHRLNTIRQADQIFFINGGQILPAQDFEDAVNLINQTKLSN